MATKKSNKTYASVAVGAGIILIGAILWLRGKIFGSSEATTPPSMPTPASASAESEELKKLKTELADLKKSLEKKPEAEKPKDEPPKDPTYGEVFEKKLPAALSRFLDSVATDRPITTPEVKTEVDPALRAKNELADLRQRKINLQNDLVKVQADCRQRWYDAQFTLQAARSDSGATVGRKLIRQKDLEFYESDGRRLRDLAQQIEAEIKTTEKKIAVLEKK